MPTVLRRAIARFWKMKNCGRCLSLPKFGVKALSTHGAHHVCRVPSRLSKPSVAKLTGQLLGKLLVQRRLTTPRLLCAPLCLKMGFIRATIQWSMPSLNLGCIWARGSPCLSSAVTILKRHPGTTSMSDSQLSDMRAASAALKFPTPKATF